MQAAFPQRAARESLLSKLEEDAIALYSLSRELTPGQVDLLAGALLLLLDWTTGSQAAETTDRDSLYSYPG